MPEKEGGPAPGGAVPAEREAAPGTVHYGCRPLGATHAKAEEATR